MKAFLYSRVSTLSQAQGGRFGIKRQIQTIQEFLKYAVIDPRLGYQLDPEDFEVIESDLGRSAFRGANWSKGNLGRFYDRVMSGEITSGILLCENIDRLVRLSNYQAQHKLSSLITRGIDIIEVESGMAFSDKIPESASVLNMSISRGYQESLRKSNMAGKSWDNRRTKAITEGKAIKNNVPRWLKIVDDKYVVDTKQQKLITHIFEQFLLGYSCSSIVDDLSSKGLEDSGVNGSVKWNLSSMYRILRDERLIGFIVSGHAEERIKLYPEAIDKTLFTRVKNKLSSTAIPAKRGTTKKQRNLFNGVSRCGDCGGAMIAGKSGRGHLLMYCLSRTMKRGCKARGFYYDIIEKNILTHLNGLTFTGLADKNKNTGIAILDDIRIINSDIDELQSELLVADDDSVLHVSRALRNKKTIKAELEAQYAAVEKQSVQQFNIADLVNPENDCECVDLNERRRDANVKLKRVIKALHFKRNDEFLLVECEYHLDEFYHVLLIGAKGGNVLGQYVISKDKVVDAGFMKMNLLSGEITVNREPTCDEYRLFEAYTNELLSGLKGKLDSLGINTVPR